MPTDEGDEETPKQSHKTAQPDKPAKAPAVNPTALLSDFLARGNYEYKAVSEEERASKILIVEKDAEFARIEKKAAMDHRRRVELISLYSLVILSAVVSCVSLWTLSDPAVSPERKAWASSLLTLIFGGFVGFLGGRISGKSEEK